MAPGEFAQQRSLSRALYFLGNGVNFQRYRFLENLMVCYSAPRPSGVADWQTSCVAPFPKPMSPDSNFVICHLACAPMRATASHLSEKTHQLLFADTCEILEPGPVFCHARSLFEGYEGWIDSRQFRPLITPAPPSGIGSVMSDEIAALAVSSERQLWLPLGALLPDYHEGNFRLGEENFHFQGQVHRVRPADNAFELLAYAMRYLHAPYYWGARTPWGIDCSGLTQMTFRAFGCTLRRDCSQQHLQGRAVPTLADAQPADLAFFSSQRNSGPGIDHVGIIAPGGKVLHASGCVRLDELTEAGIRHAQSGEFTHTLVEIRRVLF